MNNTIKVIHFAEAAGGVERYIKLFLEHVDHEKFSNVIIASKNYKSTDYKKICSKFYSVDVERTLNLRNLILSIFQVRTILKKEKPAILYCHSSFAGFIGRLASRGLKIKIIYNPHGWSTKMNINPIKKFIFKNLEKFFAQNTDKFILISRSEVDEAISFGIPHKKIELVHNGIKLQSSDTLLTTDENSNILDNAKYVIGMIGRISEQKNPVFFVELAYELNKIYDDLFFVIVGDGELRHEVESKIKYYNLDDKFYISGWVKNPEDYLKKFDQAVLFSKWEGFGLVIAEYMLYRKPVIATAVDGINDLIIDYETGLTIEQNDITTAVKKIIEIRENDKLKNKLIKNAYTRLVQMFDIKFEVNKIEKIFLELTRGE